MMMIKPVAPYSVPGEPGRGRAIALAAAVHAALLVFLWIGVRWQNETPVTVEAEVWSPQAREAAPRPLPEPKPREEVAKPVQKPVQKPIPAPIEKIEPDNKPDIALEQQKKRKAEQKKEQLKEQADKQREEKRIQLAEEKHREKDKQEKVKLEKDKQVQADLKKTELDKKYKQDAIDNKNLARIRDEEMRRITGSTVGAGAAGQAPKAQGGHADQSYIQKVGARIKSNTIFNVPEELEGNPAVEYDVELLPDGSLRGIRKIKSSGVAGFDEAVRRAIEKSAPFPVDKSGAAPAAFTVSHKPKD